MSGAHILIIEDNPMNRQLVRDLLEFRGHQVVAVSSLSEARAQWSECAPRLILLDIHLGSESGLDGLAEIRAQPALAKVPVIAVTAYAMPGDRERFLRAGFDGYSSKPIDTRQFPEYIDSFLKEC